MTDVFLILQWWFMLFVLGAVFLQLTTKIFSSFFDKGYIFAKILGIAVLSYAVYILGSVRIFSFTQINTILILIIFALLFHLYTVRIAKGKLLIPHYQFRKDLPWKIFFLEEVLFLTGLFFWAFIRSFSPDINGLEKFMDFGFINSILRADFFPPKDMWLTPFSINYYYFGHLASAVLTKLSGISSNISYNLMLATIFGLCFTASFSIGANLIYFLKSSNVPRSGIPLRERKWKIIFAGLLIAFLVTLSGNLHTIYTFFKPYENEKPVPFWQLAFLPSSFPNGYWYPNATRFIYNTIHEFPTYSWVVADLHGHVLDIPFVLLIIAVLLSIFQKYQISNIKYQINTKNKGSRLFGIGNWKLEIGNLILISFLLAVMYMTNAWDGIIYFLLATFVLGCIIFKPNLPLQEEIQSASWRTKLKSFIFSTLLIGIGFVVFSLPFSIHFKPFVSGIGVLCASKFLTNMKHIGPFLFEADHCQRSPWWQILILYGFFYFFVISFFVFLSKVVILRTKPEGSHKILRFAQNDGMIQNNKKSFLTSSDIFVLLLIILSTLLIIIPELIYIKDIYPAHYRANTMFKLVFQSFIMLSISSGYIFMRIVSSLKSRKDLFAICYLLFAILPLTLVFIYPYLATRSFYGDLKKFQGLDGTKYLKNSYASDYEAIQWINKTIKGQPVILEAQGDSYTDYGRISANTGLPTVLGWTVHEWLWRGTYDVPSPRIEDVRKLYEEADGATLSELIKKHNIQLVFIGDLERQKYVNINEAKWDSFGKIVFQGKNTKIYQLN